MTDVIDPTLNGTSDTTDPTEVLTGDDITESSKSHDNPDDLEMVEEIDSSVNANINMEVEDANEDSNAYPDTSQSDPNENLTADGEETETDEIPEEKEKDELKASSINANNPQDEDNEGSLEISEIEALPIKTETNDEDTLLSQEDDNDLLEDDEQNNYSAEETDSVLINSINENASDESKTISTTIMRSSSCRTSVRNGDASSEDKPLLIKGLLSKNETTIKTNSQLQQQQQRRNFSISDGNAIAKELEEQVGKLNQLLLLKEKEWSAILRLKKHVEYALDQVKCTQRMAKIQEGLNGPMSTTDINACMNLILSEKETFNIAERQIEESIESAENENESLQTIFPFRSSQVSSKETGVPQAKSFTATAALQKLCERKRKALDDLGSTKVSRLRITDVQSNAPQIQSKVIGNGRKGAIVDVQSIIQSHRNITGDKAAEKQRGKKSTSFPNQINMQPDRQYLKTLEELLAIAEADRQKETVTTLQPPPATTTQVNRSVTPKPKNGKPMRQSGSNSLLANASSSGSGTLAKMLSPSTHSSIGSNRNSNDVTNTSQKFSTKLPTSDTSLSLANLLATSKVETKVNIAKIKKERNMRDDDNSHVPSTQQETVPICQGCNLSRAQFVCAGCANQWYCSRECQVAAWDEHSEICSG